MMEGPQSAAPEGGVGLGSVAVGHETPATLGLSAQEV
jgi:hypothetical protein